MVTTKLVLHFKKITCLWFVLLVLMAYSNIDLKAKPTDQKKVDQSNCDANNLASSCGRGLDSGKAQGGDNHTPQTVRSRKKFMR